MGNRLDDIQDLLSQPATLDSYDWMLIATNLVAAAESLDEASSEYRAQFADVIEEINDATKGMTDPHFLKSTRAARRQRPDLFVPKY